MCGCYTSPVTQAAFSVWKPKRGLYYCEKHTDWVKALLKPKKPPMPMDPLF